MTTSAHQPIDPAAKGGAVRAAGPSRHPSRQLGVWAVILMLCLGAFTAFAPSAGAAEIDGAITSITTDSTHTSQGDRVDFACTWAVPTGSKPGDTFTLQLPDELRWFGSRSFPLSSPDGEPVATAVVDDSGLAVFTLTDYVLAHPVDVHGTCRFSTLYTVEGTGETETVEFEVSGKVVPVDIDTDEPCTQGCGRNPAEASKAMWWQDEQQTVTRSVIHGPATTRDTNEVTLTDVPQAGLAVDCTSLVTHVGRNVSDVGDVAAPTDDGRYPPVVQCTPQRLVVTWKNLPAGEYTELRVSSTVTDPSLTSYENDGTVTINGEDTPVTSEVRTSNAGGTGSGTAAPPTSTTSTTTPPTSTTTTTAPTSTTTTSTTATTTTTTTHPVATTAPSGTPSGDSEGTVETGSAETASSLAFTGSNSVVTASAALSLVLIGLVFTLFARPSRRRKH